MNVREWDSRAAYAACLVPNATASIENALHSTEEIFAFTECLLNRAAFDPYAVAHAVLGHFSIFKHIYTGFRDTKLLRVDTEQDFFSLVDNDLLVSLVDQGTRMHENANEVVVAYALSELVRRQIKIPKSLKEQVGLFYESPDFVLQVRRKDTMHEVVLSQVLPD